MAFKKIEYTSIKKVDFKITNDNTIQFSILPAHYDNYYLWNDLLENILVEMTYSQHVTISFLDYRLYDIFAGFIDECIGKSMKENCSITFNCCNKRIMSELMYSYNFFDYSNAFSINVNSLKNRYYITPMGDNLGIEIKYSDNPSEAISIIEKACRDYNVILERKDENE